MTTSPEKKNQASFPTKFRSKFVSMNRFRGWNRRQQQTYIDLRYSQLKDIQDRLSPENGEVLTMSAKHSNALLFNKIRRELKYIVPIFDGLDKLHYDERVWLEVGHKHRDQATLDRWVLISYSKTPKD